MKVKSLSYILVILCLLPLESYSQSPTDYDLHGPGKITTLLPALIWNPHNLPSGDSLYQTLIRADYQVTLIADLAPFIDSLSNYHLFIVAGFYEYGEPTLTYPEFQPFYDAVLAFLAGGGSLYWEGADALAAITDSDGRIWNYIPFIIFGISDPALYLMCIDTTLFAGIDSREYIEGPGAPYLLLWADGSQPALEAPPIGGYPKGIIFRTGSTHTMLSSFSWARLNDTGLDTRVDLIRDVMNWLSGTTDAVDPTPMPSEFSLSQNYPNPFNAQTTIEYALPNEADVTLEVFDIQGRRVIALAEGVRPAGYHRVTWDAKGLSSGLYFLRIKAGEFAETRKMVLLK